MTFAIAAYLTDEQKQRACAATYTPRTPDGRLLRTADDCCPLGVALYPNESQAVPLGVNVYFRLQALGQLAGIGDTHEDIERIEHIAAAFYDDWDAGRILDLADALGVTR